MTVSSSPNATDMPASSRRDGRRILIYFLLFFGTVAVLDGIFVYMAVSTQTGVVTEQSYEKGLAFNNRLEEARRQPDLTDKVAFDNGTLRWSLSDADGQPITGAAVSAQIVRPVQDGYDFAITLAEVGNGVYEAPVGLPLKGLWETRLKGEWDSKTYKATHPIINE